MTNFSNRLKNLRREKGLTGQELGEIFNVTKTAISYWENSKTFPDELTLKKMAEFFDVSLDYLLGRTDKRNLEEKSDSQENRMLKEFEGLSEESKKELEKYIKLLKIKDEMDKGKDEQSSTLEKNA